MLAPPFCSAHSQNDKVDLFLAAGANAALQNFYGSCAARLALTEMQQHGSLARYHGLRVRKRNHRLAARAPARGARRGASERAARNFRNFDPFRTAFRTDTILHVAPRLAPSRAARSASCLRSSSVTHHRLQTDGHHVRRRPRPRQRVRPRPPGAGQPCDHCSPGQGAPRARRRCARRR